MTTTPGTGLDEYLAKLDALPKEVIIRLSAQDDDEQLDRLTVKIMERAARMQDKRL